MPNTPNNLVPNRFQRHAYCRVSFTNKARSCSVPQETEILDDIEAQKAKGSIPPLKPGVNYINPGHDDQMEVWGYRKSWLRTSLCYLGILLTCGFLRLFLHWMPQLLLSFTHAPCSLANASKILFVEHLQAHYLAATLTHRLLLRTEATCRDIKHKQPNSGNEHYQEKYCRYHVKDVQLVTASDIGETAQPKDYEEKNGECLDDVQVLTDFRQQGEEMPKLALHFTGGVFEDVESLRMVRVKKRLYFWQSNTNSFEALQGLDHDVPAAVLHQLSGLSVQQQTMRRLVYGPNEILVPVQSIIALLFLEILNPFYVFQFFSFCLWFADDYIYYASAILLMSVGGVTVSIIQTRRNQINLHSTVHSRDVAVVRRLGGATETISTDELVPGDIIVLPAHGCVLHCDAALLSGNCIVNESMLTGESEPVTKTPLPNPPGLIYDSREHARHTLFCGTKLLQTRFYAGEPVLAVVVQTGFLTSKGGLVRSMLYPPPVDFRFERDSYRFIEVLAFIASLGFTYTVISKHMRGVGFGELMLDALDLITIVVPPALPAAMTVGRMYAQSRLSKANVFCISPRTINVSGSLDCICFDKTGTLTEEGLDLWGILPVENGVFEAPIQDLPEKSITMSCVPAQNINDLIFAMASAHSLTLIDGKLAGDPLDLKMFESTGWILEEPAVDDSTKYDQMFPTVVQPPRPDILLSTQIAETEFPQAGIVRQFPFSSSLQRMSVMVKALWEPEFRIFTKGAPEAIVSLCRPDSVPKDFSRQLHEYTRQGLRVLAMAGRKMKTQYHRVHRLAREDAEKDLTLLGLLVMENRLKKDSASVVARLREACIRCIMITGDNMLTALSVARDCGLVAANEKVAAVHVAPAQNGSEAKVYYTNCDAHDLFNSKDNKIEINGDVGCSSLLSSSAASPVADHCVLTVSGPAWQALRTSCPDMIQTVATRGAVFARMSPEHKQQLVQELQALGYCVGMVGDGANDCGALKAAHTGISLSDAESSVASPFTSREPSVSCVEKVMREGRAALVTSFGLFKYMAAYSLTQFTSVVMLYRLDTNLTDIQFLFIDLFIITIIAFFFGQTKAHPGALAKRPPSASLFSPAPIISLVGQLILVVLAQVSALLIIQMYPWFEPYKPSDEGIACYENYAVFTVSSFQYIVLALVFSQGAPYRKPLTSNKGLVITLVLTTLTCLCLTIAPPDWLETAFELRLPPTWHPRFVILGLAIGHFIFSWSLEFALNKSLANYREGKQAYELVEKQICADATWPQLSSEYPQSSTPETPDTPSTRMQVVYHTPETSPRHRRHLSGEVTLDPAMLISQVQRTPSRLDSC